MMSYDSGLRDVLNSARNPYFFNSRCPALGRKDDLTRVRCSRIGLCDSGADCPDFMADDIRF